MYIEELVAKLSPEDFKDACTCAALPIDLQSPSENGRRDGNKSSAMSDKMTMTADMAVPLFAFFRKTVKPDTAILIPSPTGVTPYTFANISEFVTIAKAMLRVLIFLALCIITSLIFIISFMDSGL